MFILIEGMYENVEISNFYILNLFLRGLPFI